MNPADETPVSDQLAKTFARGDIPIASTKKQATEKQPVYRMVGESRIPVSKHLGKLFKSRVAAAAAKRKALNIAQAWDEAIRYYKNDQQTHRIDTGNSDRAQNARDTISDAYSETENIVFANTSALVPMIYSKNPIIENTVMVEELQPLATRVERLVNHLFAMETTPGLNIKPIGRAAIVLTTLTNNSWVELGWTFKDASTEEAFAEMDKLATEYAEAKDTKVIQEIEGKLMAIDAKIDVLRPAGPFVRLRKPHDILFDAAAERADGFDANWFCDYDYINTEFLRAMYAEKDENGQYNSVYKPTHVMKLNDGAKDGIDETVNQFSLLNESGDTNDYRIYGFEDPDTFRKSLMTRVCRVWDKVTRRVYLFNDKDWSWPIWVWDDPYQFPNFFPFRPLQFYIDPIGDEAKGEVVYYLDQQDAINEINSEKHLARQWARKNVYYDRNRVQADDVDQIISGKKQGAIGVDLDEGQSLDDAIKAFVPPSMNFMQLFDKQPQLDAIDRLSSVQGVMRGAQFKTNTTNDAINKYDAVSQTRLDEKIDCVEDFFGRVGQDIAYLCLRFMPAEMVDELIGPSEGVQWTQMNAKDAAKLVATMRVVGGSTRKPSSAMKKEEATQVGQILGQFVKASPASLVVALKMLEKAFDSVTITEEDWAMIRQSIEQQMQQSQGEGGGQDLAKIFDQLPPEAKKAFGDATAKGAPAEQVLSAIVQELQGSQQQAPQPEPNPTGVE